MTVDTDWVSVKRQELIRKGKQQFNRSKYLEISENDHEASEELARSALKTLRSAMNWTEDTDEFEPTHQLLDQVGRFVRSTFGCHLLYEDGVYFQTCPVSLAHNRIGLSIGFVARKVECSICLKDPEDCPHITGRIYDGIICVRRIVDGEILDVSIVDRPRQPDTRFEKISLRTDSLRRSLPKEWKPGTPVSCDQCLTPCAGVVEHDFGHGSPNAEFTKAQINPELKFEGILAVEEEFDGSESSTWNPESNSK